MIKAVVFSRFSSKKEAAQIHIINDGVIAAGILYKNFLNASFFVSLLPRDTVSVVF